ncbi:hypothetical protein PIB30_110509, partial [Stylosanthes scabra]|nr:hypothetical protein [Stylosanthes scabra]
ELLNVTYIGGGKYSVGEMSTDHRLFHYMLSYLWLPRKGNHGVLTEEDTFIIRAFVEEVELNWPYLIARRLMQYTDNSVRKMELPRGMSTRWVEALWRLERVGKTRRLP